MQTMMSFWSSVHGVLIVHHSSLAIPSTQTGIFPRGALFSCLLVPVFTFMIHHLRVNLSSKKRCGYNMASPPLQQKASMILMMIETSSLNTFSFRIFFDFFFVINRLYEY